MKEMLKKLARLLVGEYAIYQIYTLALEGCAQTKPGQLTTYRIAPVDASAIKASPDALIREQVGYTGPGSHSYACFDGDRIVGVCFYWFGSRYLTRNFWPLAEGEVKLVQIVSLPEMRGCGVATTLITWSCLDLVKKGFIRAYARIWHTNTPSLRAFKSSGWRQIALVIEIRPFRQTRPIRLRFNSNFLHRKT